MKQLLIICTLLLSSITISSAQNRDFHALQADVIIKRLDIKESVQDEFKEIYSEYNSKIRDMRPKHRPNDRKETPSEQEIEQQILASFDIAEKTTALKREYYLKFKTILSADQILKMYNIERQISERINSEVQNRASGKRHEGDPEAPRAPRAN